MNKLSTVKRPKNPSIFVKMGEKKTGYQQIIHILWITCAWDGEKGIFWGILWGKKKLLDLLVLFEYTRNAISYSEEVCPNENDVSAEKAFSCKSSRFPCQNEQRRWTKSIGFQKSKGKKTAFSIGRTVVYAFHSQLFFL